MAEVYKIMNTNKILTNKQYLLLTGTIDSQVYNNVGNKITDTKVRLQQYETSLEKYITESVFTDIVFVENSGFQFDSTKFEKLACENNKRFEFISGKVCKQEIIEYGKSFGDAYLIYEGLQKSKLLENCEYFYKITGRIFLKNSKKICKTSNKYRNEFIVYEGLGWCLTNIFKANKEDYLKYLGDVWKDCNEKTVNDIEISFYRRLSASDMKISSFEIYPHFDGVMGATLRNYSGGIMERTLRNILARMHFFAYGARTSRLMKLALKFMGKKAYVE